MTIYLLIWVIMAVFVAMIANSRGRNPALWFVYGAIFWPIALIHVSLLRDGADPPAPTTPGHLPEINLWAKIQDRDKGDKTPPTP